MEEIKNLLKAREKELLKIKNDKTKEIESLPSGTLRISSHGTEHNITNEIILKSSMVFISKRRILI